MFNNIKSKEIFDPESTKSVPVHVIGCGSVGSRVVATLSRLGVRRLNIWDFDSVESHNLANQIFRNKDIGKKKTDAIEEIVKEINPEIEVIKHEEYTIDKPISGYVFLAIDNIDKRREFCQSWLFNPNVKFITDARMRDITAEIFSANWQNKEARENLLKTMNYTHAEALAATPRSACGMSISVIYCPEITANLMVSNWVKFVNTKEYSIMTSIDTGHNSVTSFSK